MSSPSWPGSPPVVSGMVGATLVTSGFRLWTGAAVVGANGQVVVFPTSDGTATGAPIFTNVLFGSAVVTNATNVSTCAFGSLTRVSTSQQSVTFTMLAGTGVLLGGVTVAALASGSTVTVMLLGL